MLYYIYTQNYRVWIRVTLDLSIGEIGVVWRGTDITQCRVTQSGGLCFLIFLSNFAQSYFPICLQSYTFHLNIDNIVSIHIYMGLLCALCSTWYILDYLRLSNPTCIWKAPFVCHSFYVWLSWYGYYIFIWSNFPSSQNRSRPVCLQQ